MSIVCTNLLKSLYRSNLAMLVLLFFISACSENITTECEPVSGSQNGKTLSNFSEIQKQIFTPSCALSGCHAGSNIQANLNLSEGNSYNNLVAIQSLLNPAFLRVKPGDSENSFLVKMLRNSGNGSSLMPPSGKLSDAVIDSIVTWINNGAFNN